MNTINFTAEDLKICKDFSEQVDTSFYETRNQFNSSKRTKDSCIGKLGELAVYYSLKDKYPNITYPDFKIYPANQKSWDFDLKDEKFNLHVKSQDISQSFSFGETWIFQNEDKHIFKNHSAIDYVAFVIVNIPKKQGIVKQILPVTLLHEMRLFKKPILVKLATKSAIYFEDIEHLDIHLM